MESITCCTPVIATLTSNISDYLKDGKNGFVVDDSHSLDDVFGLISKLSPSEIIQMKEACKNCTVFDYREYRNSFEQIFK